MVRRRSPKSTSTVTAIIASESENKRKSIANSCHAGPVRPAAAIGIDRPAPRIAESRVASQLAKAA